MPSPSSPRRCSLARRLASCHPVHQFADIPVMAAYLLLIGLLFVVINPRSTCSISPSTRACATRSVRRAGPTDMAAGDLPAAPRRR